MPVPIIHARPWKNAFAPSKILVLRFQAIGDVIITLPYLQDLKNKLPRTEIHFLTREEAAEIPRSLDMFSRIIEIRGGRKTWLQFLHIIGIIPWLFFQRYDCIIDLQNHWISRLLRRILTPRYWSQFDRDSHVPAGMRVQSAINAARLADVIAESQIIVKHSRPREASSRSSETFRVVLNPAGAFSSRNWPLENYVAFAKLCLATYPNTEFLIIGTHALREKAAILKNGIDAFITDLTGETSLSDAFEMIGGVQFVISEDSGLMHMAWTQGVPTIAIFGSTPAYWSRPLGARSFCFASSDLPCGDCFAVHCRFGDNHCLTRVTPQAVFKKFSEML